MGFEDWLRELDVWGRLDPDRVVDTVGVLIVVVAYYRLVEWARDKLILTPFRDGIRSDLDELGRRVALLEPDDAHGLLRRIEELDRELVEDPDPWTGATLYRALLLRREADHWLAGAGDSSEVRGRARVVAHALDDAHAWLREDLLGIAAGRGRLDRRERELVRRAVILTTPDTTTATAQQLTLHRKTNWLVLTGLGVVVLLTAAFGNAAITILGILGAFLSRISTFTRQRASNELAFNWTTVILSPVVGALAALGGVLVVEVLVAWEVLGDVISSVGWGSTSSQTLLVAFLLGFSERLLDSLVGVATNKLGVPPASEEEPVPPSSGGGDVSLTERDTDGTEAELDRGQPDEPDADEPDTDEPDTEEVTLPEEVSADTGPAPHRVERP